MHLIQPMLVTALLVALVLYLRFLRTGLRDRILVILFFAVAMIAVLIPDFTQDLAKLVGVGRGTDLTFYAFAVAAVFFVALVYSKFATHDRVLTELVRRLAIAEAEGVAARAGRSSEATGPTSDSASP